MNAGLTLEKLTLPKEKSYFVLVLMISLISWLILAATIIGLVYAVFIGIALWFGNGLMIAHLKSEGVLVDGNQLPALHRALQEVCEQLKVQRVPELYILQAGGLLNAFATRFCGRSFVVVYSDMLEAFGEDSPQMRFILGHEVGHIRRGHILKHLLLLPGRLVPLLGPAYSRACEVTCDRHGAFACKDIEGGVQAMMALSGGKQAGLTMSPAAFARQHHAARGFFVSLHELLSGYPTLSQRVSHLVSLRDGETPYQARRNPLAYIFAIFSPNLIVAVSVISILASVAVPATLGAVKKAKEVQALTQQRQQQFSNGAAQATLQVQP